MSKFWTVIDRDDREHPIWIVRATKRRQVRNKLREQHVRWWGRWRLRQSWGTESLLFVLSTDLGEDTFKAGL